MRILIINTYYAPEIMGGAELSVKKLAETLSKTGHEVCVLCTGDKYVEEVIEGVHIIRIKSKHCCRAININNYCKPKRILRRIQDLWNPNNKRLIQQVIDSFKPDVVHTNGLYDISPIVWKCAHDHCIRVVHTLRDYYLICPRVSMNCYKSNGMNCKPSLFCSFHRFRNRISSKYVDAVTSPSSMTLNILINHGFFKQVKEKVVIPNAIDFELSNSISILKAREVRLSEEKKKVRFVFLGTFSEEKGIKWLLESYKSVFDAELFFVGKGPLEKYIRDKAVIDKSINIVGFLNEKRMNELLQSSDVVICPSLWNEPFGRVVLDAYKNGMPIIVSNKGALSELVNDKEMGIVVESGNVSKLAEAMKFYIQNKEAIHIQGRSSIEELMKYSLVVQAENFLDIYNV